MPAAICTSRPDLRFSRRLDLVANLRDSKGVGAIANGSALSAGPFARNDGSSFFGCDGAGCAYSLIQPSRMRA